MSSGCRPGQQGGECNLCGVSCGAGLGGYEPHACHGGRAGGPVRACADVFPGAGAEQTPGSSISAPQAQRLSHFLDFSFTYFTATHSDNYFCFLCAFLCWAPFNPGNNLLAAFPREVQTERCEKRPSAWGHLEAASFQGPYSSVGKTAPKHSGCHIRATITSHLGLAVSFPWTTKLTMRGLPAGCVLMVSGWRKLKVLPSVSKSAVSVQDELEPSPAPNIEK
ncbi:uncharacterized protein [Manis javanica]|uniref:uncharacterized protein n=1 Tax=Manis javanica TaxID=9974 RepID=UPI003C6D9F1F